MLHVVCFLVSLLLIGTSVEAQDTDGYEGTLGKMRRLPSEQIETLHPQSLQDVVYLNNGSIVRGTIIEIVPQQSIRISTYNGSIFVYEFDEVLKITKGSSSVPSSSVEAQDADGYKRTLGKMRRLPSEQIETLHPQSLQDVVYLNNGSIVRGTIIEIVPQQSIRISTYDGSIFVYEFDEVLKITKGPSSVLSSYERKNPGTALLCSFLITGGGQFYNEEGGKGTVMLGIGIVSLWSWLAAIEDNEYYRGRWYDLDDDNTFGGIMVLVGAVNWIISMTDAYASAKKINRQRLPPTTILRSISSQYQKGAIVILSVLN